MPAKTLRKRATGRKKNARRKSSAIASSNSASYNRFKEFNGQQYTGMQVGRGHKWNYDKGVWTETKVTPDRWEMVYDVMKRRAGHAPEGSGAPVGTGYHWFILAHQYVEKLNADDYMTAMVGSKFKLAHKRSTVAKWSVSDNKLRTNLIEALETLIAEIKAEPEKALPIPLEFEYKSKSYRGIGIPIISTCNKGICQQVDIVLNNKHVGVLRMTKNGWRINKVPQGLVNEISKLVIAGMQKIKEEFKNKD